MKFTRLPVPSKSNCTPRWRTGSWQPVKDWILVRLALLSGLRASELADLKVVDCFIGYGHSEIVVRRSKNGKSRVVKISPDLKRDIRWFLKWKSDQGELHPEAHLIKGHRKERVSRVTLRKRWKKLCPQHRLHDARHSHATTLYAATKDLRLVQKQLGHSRPSITAIYADVADARAREGDGEALQERRERAQSRRFFSATLRFRPAADRNSGVF